MPIPSKTSVRYVLPFISVAGFLPAPLSADFHVFEDDPWRNMSHAVAQSSVGTAQVRAHLNRKDPVLRCSHYSCNVMSTAHMNGKAWFTEPLWNHCSIRISALTRLVLM